VGAGRLAAIAAAMTSFLIDSREERAPRVM
jgi:hypothetical protein